MMHNSRDGKIKSVNGPSGENRVSLRALALFCLVFPLQCMSKAERREVGPTVTISPSTPIILCALFACKDRVVE